LRAMTVPARTSPSPTCVHDWISSPLLHPSHTTHPGSSQPADDFILYHPPPLPPFTFFLVVSPHCTSHPSCPSFLNATPLPVYPSPSIAIDIFFYDRPFRKALAFCLCHRRLSMFIVDPNKTVHSAVCSNLQCSQ
jgi:hypothetical protein